MTEISLQEVKEYLQVDFSDDDAFINDLIVTARIYIDSMVGEYYKENDKLVNLSNLLMRKLIYTMYEVRGAEISSNAKADRITQSILDKLAVEGYVC